MVAATHGARLLDDPRREDYLGLVPDHLRNRATLALLRPLRDGADTPAAAYDAALAALRARLGRWGAADPETTLLLATLLHQRAAALAFCTWLRDWDALPRAEQERITAGRGAPHRRAYLAGQTATDQQRASRRTLGYRGDVTSKAHASALGPAGTPGLRKARVS